jgi:arylsulfatase A-like enzyme
MSNNQKAGSVISRDGKAILSTAAWFGLVAGLVEALIFVISIQIGRSLVVWYEIVWISPLVYLVGYSLVGLVLVLLQRLLPRLPWMLISVALFAFVTFFDWVVLILTDRVMIFAQVVLALGLTTVTMRIYKRYQDRFSRLCRRSLPALLVTVAVLLVVVQGGMWLKEKVGLSRLPELPSGSPNVLVVMVDTLRADHLSTYGYERQTSPNIDQIAAQGVLFENAYGGSNYSYTSHASFFTGLPLDQHKAEWDNLRALFNLDAPVFPELLRDAGYRTGGFSANTFWVTRKDGFGRGFLHYEDFFTTPLDAVLRTGIGLAFEKLILSRLGEQDIPARRWADDINAAALEWIDQEPTQPFFVFLNYLDVHDPYLPPQPYRNLYTDVPNPGGLLNWHLGREYLDLTPEELQSEMDAYDGAINYADEQIAALLKDLENRGLAENTLLVIVSDHGEAFAEHGVYLHGNSLYREELHVPLIFYWPGHLPAGRRVSQPVSIDSIGSTLLELTGSPFAAQFPDHTLVSFWQEDGDVASYPMPLAEANQKPWYDEHSLIRENSLRSLFDDQWQYIWADNHPEELYDVANDNLETNNLASDPASADTMENFRSELKARTKDQSKTTGDTGE